MVRASFSTLLTVGLSARFHVPSQQITSRFMVRSSPLLRDTAGTQVPESGGPVGLA